MITIDRVDLTSAIAGGVLISIGVFISIFFYGKQVNFSEIFNRMYKFQRDAKMFWNFNLISGFLSVTYLLYKFYGNDLNIRGRQI